ncbi:ABC transporter permease [Anaerosporobacter faecicola]|uniref:ABC transporter permease n=1 Tax=Anaerosporobacter faecicola TaxID=2718714 RepID=UPI00143CBFAE|nr:ABC transporter permease [Anaerosporobacter faecicola]
MDILLAMLSASGQGLLWAVLALGIYITFKILDIADMTCDGSFALGGCLSVTLIVSGWNPILSLLMSILAGMLAGLVTGFLHTKLKIPAILAGILSMIALYSINLRVLGQPNESLLKSDTIVTLIKKLIPDSIMNSVKYSTMNSFIVIGIGIVFCIILCCILYWFFGTEVGSALRATGSNEDMIRALGQNTDRMKILGLIISNGLIALSGGLVAQSQGYGDVIMGQGSIVIGLASIVIGEVFFGRKISFVSKLLSVIFGSVVYRVIIAIVLQLGLNNNDQKLFTALIVAIALSIPVIKNSKFGMFVSQLGNKIKCSKFGLGIKKLFGRKKKTNTVITSSK